MKRLSVIATIAALALIVTACGKENGAATNENMERAAVNQQQWEVEEAGVSVDYSEIAPEIMMFVETHFPQTGIYNCHQTQHYYKVKLNDQTKLKFNHSLEWVEVDCEHSAIYGIVPSSIVPEQITDYVTVNFPNNHIDQIEKKNNGNWEIELDNDHDIKFDANFNVISGGGNGGGGNGGGNNSNYPEINTFVGTHFPQVSIRKVERDGNKYEVELTDNTDIDFSLSFVWKKVDCDESNVYGSVPASIVPVQITDYVTANFPNKHIDSIEKKNNGGWEIELNNGLEITFDANFNVTGFDDKKQ